MNYMNQSNFRVFLTVNILFLLTVTSLIGRGERLGKLLEDVELGTYEARKMAIMRCGGDRVVKCYRILLDYLKDPDIDSQSGTEILSDIDMQKAAARSLSLLRLKEAIPKLKEAIQKTSQKILEKKNIVQNIENSPEKILEYREEKKILKKLYSLKADMIFALGSAREKSELPYLMEFMKDPNALIRLKAAVCISYVATKKEQMRMDDYLKKEKDESVKVAIIRVLLAVDRFNLNYISQFVQLLKSDDPKVRKLTAQLGGDFRIKEGRAVLHRVMLLEHKKDVFKAMSKYSKLIVHY